MAKERTGYSLNQSPLYRLTKKKRLAELLGVTIKQLHAFTRTERLYKERESPKKKGGIRKIEDPRHDLKMVQRRIARLLARIRPPEYLSCPVRGRSYVTNASRHIGSRVIRTIDVKKYFPNTKCHRVFWFFRTVMECEPDVAEILAKIATYQGHLPTGSPLSPIMAFYAHCDVWEEVARLANSIQAKSTLYIDDFTISGAQVPGTAMWDIKKVVHRSGLRYHKEKSYCGHAAEVTGVIVNGGKLVPPNRQFLKRWRLDNATRRVTNPREKDALTAQLHGLSAQMAQIKAANRS